MVKSHILSCVVSFLFYTFFTLVESRPCNSLYNGMCDVVCFFNACGFHFKKSCRCSSSSYIMHPFFLSQRIYLTSFFFFSFFMSALNITLFLISLFLETPFFYFRQFRVNFFSKHKTFLRHQAYFRHS